MKPVWAVTRHRRKAPPAASDYFAGASLVALPKKDGGLRPVAVGGVLRRLVGKCLCWPTSENEKAIAEKTAKSAHNEKADKHNVTSLALSAPIRGC